MSPYRIASTRAGEYLEARMLFHTLRSFGPFIWGQTVIGEKVYFFFGSPWFQFLVAVGE